MTIASMMTVASIRIVASSRRPGRAAGNGLSTSLEQAERISASPAAAPARGSNAFGSWGRTRAHDPPSVPKPNVQPRANVKVPAELLSPNPTHFFVIPD